MKNRNYNVLFYTIINNGIKGGIEKLISELSNNSKKYGFNSYILCDSVEKDIFPYKLNNDVHIDYIKSNTSDNFLKTLRNYTVQNNIDIVVIMRTGSFMHMMFCAALKDINIPIILSEHASPSIATKEFPECSRTSSLYCVDAVHLLHKDFLTSIAKELLSKCTIINNFVDDNYNKNILKKNKIVMVGRLTKIQKRPFLLVEAFYKIKDMFPDWELHFYGDGPEYNIINNFINNNNLNNRIFLHGQVDNVINEIQDAKIFCLPSAYEGLPISILESFSLGIPVIVFKNADGNRNIVTNMKTGILVDDGKLHEGLMLLMNNDRLLNEMSLNCLIESQKYNKYFILKKWFIFLKNSILKGDIRNRHLINEKILDDIILGSFIDKEGL